MSSALSLVHMVLLTSATDYAMSVVLSSLTDAPPQSSEKCVVTSDLMFIVPIVIVPAVVVRRSAVPRHTF